MASKGELFELRIARLLAAEGAVVRRRVNLDQGAGKQVTDLDVLAFSFDQTLRLRLVSGECKTAEAKSAPSTKDRLLWLVGVNRLVGADFGFMATIRAAREDDREMARTLGLELIDPGDLERRERVLGIVAGSNWGVHTEAALTAERQLDTAVAKDDELRRVVAFARSELWLAPPVASLKRALGAMRVVGNRWSDGLEEGPQRLLRLLFTDIVLGFTIALARLAGESYRTPEKTFEPYLNERLAEGLANFAAMREIAKEVDRFLVGVLREAGVDETHVIGAVGALAPRPPAYAEPLLELVQRLAAEPRLTARLPAISERYASLDYVIAEEGHEPDEARLLRLVAAFVEKQGKVPAALVAPLRWRPAAPEDDNQARAAELSLFPERT